MQVEFHFHQEGVTLGTDVIQVDPPQNGSLVSHKSRCHVMNRHTGEQPGVKTRTEAQKTSRETLILCAPSLDIPGPNDYGTGLEHLDLQ